MSMKHNALLVGTLLCLTLNASAQDQQAQQLLAKLKQQYPTTKFTSIATSPVDGLYEVVMGKNVAYIEKSGRYWLFGHVWDQQTQTDLTEGKIASLDTIDVSKLPLDLAIRTVNGKPSRRLIVFSDPNCGYCKGLERDLPQLKDTEIFTFMTPVLGPASAAKTAAIWCAPDRAKAWNKWMTEQIDPASTQLSNCAAPVEKLKDLAKAMNVQGTPTMFAQDGRRQVGSFGSASALSVWLNATPGNAKSERDGTPVVMSQPTKRQ